VLTRAFAGLRKNYSMPNFSASSTFDEVDGEDQKEGSPKRGIRFCDKGNMMVKIGVCATLLAHPLWVVCTRLVQPLACL
jgi:hypothetical protein